MQKQPQNRDETIEIKKENVRTSGSCNACSRYHTSTDELRPVYPYTEVYALYVGLSLRQQIRFCDDCLKRLKAKIDECEATKLAGTPL